jgi:tRNA A37 threonylcarbamoyladenosine modification protein TsaB
LPVSRLALENSSETGTLAVRKASGDIQSFSFRGSGELGSILQVVLPDAGLLEELVVGIGPGSYTGIRVAIATAIGLEWSLGCKNFGCPSVLGYSEPSYAIIGDARRDSFAVAIVRDSVLVERPRLIGREVVAEFIDKNRSRPLFALTRIPGWPDLELRYPKAEYLFDKQREYLPLTEPLYLKEPHITTPNKTR